MAPYGKVGIVAFLLFANVHSALGCERFHDKPDKYSLSRYLVDSIHPELRTTEQLQKCVQEQISNCLYRDNEGLVYGLFGDDSDIAASIQMLHPRVLGVSADKTYTGRLIADLKIGDTMEDVRQKLKSLPPEFPNRDLETDGSGPKLVTACRIRSSNDAEWYYVLGFDSEGKLESVAAEQDDPEAAI